MNLEKHIGPHETIQLRFGLGVVYLSIKLLAWGVLLGGLSYFFRENVFFAYPPLVIFGLVVLYELLIFFTTHYFVTEKKVYKKRGVLWKKIVEAEKSDVTDITVVRGFLDKLLFFAGDLKINTAGSPTIEVILNKVQNPYAMKKEIAKVWEREN